MSSKPTNPIPERPSDIDTGEDKPKVSASETFLAIVLIITGIAVWVFWVIMLLYI